MLERMPFWGRVALMLAIAAAIVSVSYWLWPNIAAMNEKVAELQDTYADKDREIRKGRAIEQRMPEFKREVASLEQKLDDITQILPRQTETGDLLRWIKNLGDQSNLELKSFAPGELRPVEFYKEFPIQMQIVGTYHDLGIFLDRVSKYSRIINVDNLKVNNAKDKNKTIRAKFTATTFVSQEMADEDWDVPAKNKQGKGKGKGKGKKGKEAVQ